MLPKRPAVLDAARTRSHFGGMALRAGAMYTTDWRGGGAEGVGYGRTGVGVCGAA